LWRILNDEAAISKLGKQECGFAEALAYAHELAKWNRCQFIYAFDDSTWDCVILSSLSNVLGEQR
jgi:hypothetical protein